MKHIQSGCSYISLSVLPKIKIGMLKNISTLETFHLRNSHESTPHICDSSVECDFEHCLLGQAKIQTDFYQECLHL